ASVASRVFLCTCNARYSTDKTTAIEPTSCEIALSASQFMSALYHKPSQKCHSEWSEESLIILKRGASGNNQRCFASLNMTALLMDRAYFGSSASLRTILPRV